MCVLAWQDIITNITSVLIVSNIDVTRVPPPSPTPVKKKKKKKKSQSVIAKINVLHSCLFDHEV